MKKLKIISSILLIPFVILSLVLVIFHNSLTPDQKDMLYAILGALIGFDISMFFYLMRPNINVKVSNPEGINTKYEFKIINLSRYDAYNITYEFKIAWNSQNNTTTDTFKQHNYMLLKNKSDSENFITCSIEKQKLLDLSERFSKRHIIQQNDDIYYFLRISLQHEFSNYSRVFQSNYTMSREKELILREATSL